jgi:hypothetical protein
VIDPADNEVVATIPVGLNPIDVAIAPPQEVMAPIASAANSYPATPALQ